MARKSTSVSMLTTRRRFMWYVILKEVNSTRVKLSRLQSSSSLMNLLQFGHLVPNNHRPKVAKETVQLLRLSPWSPRQTLTELRRGVDLPESPRIEHIIALQIKLSQTFS